MRAWWTFTYLDTDSTTSIEDKDISGTTQGEETTITETETIEDSTKTENGTDANMIQNSGTLNKAAIEIVASMILFANIYSL